MPSAAVAKIIKREFGPLWDVYNSNRDVKAVIDMSIKEGWYNDETKVTEALRGTNWFKNTEQSARQYAIKLSTDPATMEDQIKSRIADFRATSLKAGFTFDDVTLRRLATDSIKFGWSEQEFANNVGSEAVAQSRAGGAEGIANLRTGNIGVKLRQIAKAYNQTPSTEIVDTYVADILSGRKDEQQFVDLMKTNAKMTFRSLAPMIDEGVDVKTALSTYQQTAQRSLGSVMDLTDIDWSQDRWNKVVNYKDPKTNEYRMMDLYEFNKYLRQQPEWQKTEDASRAYRNVTQTLVRAFGGVM